MNKRKDQLRAMFEGSGLENKPSEVFEQEEGQTEGKSRAPSGAVKAMGLSLDNLSRSAKEADRLRVRLEAGERIVELDPGMIEGSIIDDRLSEGTNFDEQFDALKASILESGQQVPVLVRIHPDVQKAQQGWYQSAYGHRRIRAARELGVQVKAIIRTLDDTEMIVAQGKENAERRDLSYIERAIFAKSMIDRGFDRKTAMAALSIDKTEISRLLQMADAIPLRIIRAIGPASKAGRNRWQSLAGLLNREAQKVKADDEITKADFLELSSDLRFQKLLDRLSKSTLEKTVKAKPIAIKSRDGVTALGYVISSARKTNIELSLAEHADFAAFLATKIPELALAFERSKAGKKEKRE